MQEGGLLCAVKITQIGGHLPGVLWIYMRLDHLKRKMGINVDLTVLVIMLILICQLNILTTGPKIILMCLFCICIVSALGAKCCNIRRDRGGLAGEKNNTFKIHAHVPDYSIQEIDKCIQAIK